MDVRSLRRVTRAPEVSMSTPLDIAVDISRIVREARESEFSLNLADCADELISRFPQTGISRVTILDTLREEAGAIGLTIN